MVNATNPGAALPELTVEWHDPAYLHESSLTTPARGGHPFKSTSPWHLGRPWAGAAAHGSSPDSSRRAGWEFVGWIYTGSPLGSKLAGPSLPLGCGSAGGPGRLPACPGAGPCASAFSAAQGRGPQEGAISLCSLTLLFLTLGWRRLRMLRPLQPLQLHRLPQRGDLR